MTERVVTDVNETEWDAYVTARPDASAYHQWVWRRIFENSFGHETRYFAAVDNGTIVGVLPTVVFETRLFGRFLVSLPFVDYGGIVADSPAAVEALVSAAARFAFDRHLRFLELRHTRRTVPALPAKQHKVSMRLGLAHDEAGAWESLDRKVRNQVRKAEKSGLTFAAGGRELLDDFYPVFAQNMRDLGTPVYGRRFFDAVLSEPGAGAQVFVVRHGPSCIATAIACRHRDVMQVPWASSLRAYRTLAPNTLLYWNAIRSAIAAGMKTFDFGRSTPGEGTFQFKKQWGAVPAPLIWEYWLADHVSMPDLSPKNPKFRLAISTWRHLPVPVTRWLGPALVRNLP